MYVIDCTHHRVLCPTYAQIDVGDLSTSVPPVSHYEYLPALQE
jgi:hypothetical protein